MKKKTAKKKLANKQPAKKTVSSGSTSNSESGRYTGVTSEQRAAQERATFQKFEAGYGDRGILTARAAYEHAKFLDRARNPVKHTY